MLVLPSCDSLHASCGKRSLSAACTQLVGRQDLQIVSTNRIFQACALSQLSQSSNQSLRGNIHPAQTRHISFFFPLLLFVLNWGHALFLWEFGDGLCMVYFYGTAIWRPSKCQGHLSCSSSAPWLLCGEKERHRPILRFMTYCVKRAPRQTGGSPDVRSSWTRLTRLKPPSSIL